jgi:hypothetical protein
VWPPGEIDREFRGDTRDCIACHMTPRNEDEKPGRREHRWSARRNLTLLRDGIILAAAQPHAGEPRDGVRLVLTNLAGHAYPTGTRRRAVRLHARSDDAAETLAASLVPVRPGVAPAGGQPPLAPGETRAFFVPVPRASASVTWRLVYYRNPADPEAYTAEIRAGEAQPKR